MLDRFRQFLDLPLLSRIRTNHGLEHATIHILSQRFPKTTLVGRSDSRGFYLFGDISTEALRQSVSEALERLRRGEYLLAIHPNCGTNLVVSATLAGAVSYLALLGFKEEGWRKRLERLPLAIAGSVIALIVSQPIGKAAQQHITTNANPGSLEVTDINNLRRGRAIVHRVLTRH